MSSRPKKAPLVGNPAKAPYKPWPALWSLVVGFFMILVDGNIVTIALPHMLQDLEASLSAGMWVTSAYLLAYAVPLLITGRMGDRFGQKNLYMIGMGIFTLASLWCGPVSYTHLDVYKRQGCGLPSGRSDQCCTPGWTSRLRQSSSRRR